MEIKYEEQMVELISKFHLPTYHEIPDVGLYLEQCVKYINDYLGDFPNFEITSSMVSNYVKKGLVERPIKKCYYRDQIAYLMFISMAKSVMTMENVQLLISLQQASKYSKEVAYEYCREQLDEMIQYVFGFRNEAMMIGNSDSKLKVMCRNTLIALSYKMYLDLCCEVLKHSND